MAPQRARRVPGPAVARVSPDEQMHSSKSCSLSQSCGHVYAKVCDRECQLLMLLDNEVDDG